MQPGLPGRLKVPREMATIRGSGTRHPAAKDGEAVTGPVWLSTEKASLPNSSESRRRRYLRRRWPGYPIGSMIEPVRKGPLRYCMISSLATRELGSAPLRPTGWPCSLKDRRYGMVAD